MPLQGFLNAVAYGWTRGDFLSVMSTTRHLNDFSQSQSHCYGSVEKTERRVEKDQEEEEEEEEEECERVSSFHLQFNGEGEGIMDFTPETPQSINAHEHA